LPKYRNPAVEMIAISIAFSVFMYFIHSKATSGVTVRTITINLYNPVYLTKESKFHKLFVSQFYKSLRSSTEQLPLFFLPNQRGCAVVVLIIEALSDHRNDLNEFAIGETVINSDGTYLLIYGYNPMKQRFDQLFKGRVANFYGSYYETNGRIRNECPDILVSKIDQDKDVHQYRLRFDLSRLRYIQSNIPVRARINKVISW
jgi:hypothetical protein